MRKAVVTMFHRCNYACGFCYLQPRNRMGDLGPLGTRDGMRALGDLFARYGEWELHLTGGEPSIHPEFFAVCRELTERHVLSLSTNLSFDVAFFLRAVPATRIVSVSATLQPEGERDLEGFIAKLHLLREAGIVCAAAYVATPERLPGLPELMARFREERIPLCVQALNGEYRGKKFPAAYIEEEQQVIRDHSILYISPLLLDLDQKSHPHGEPCGAGCSRVIVDGMTGTIRPCAHLPAIGDLQTGKLRLLSKPLHCPVGECICELNDTLQQFHEERLAHHYAVQTAITAAEWHDFVAMATRNRDWRGQVLSMLTEAQPRPLWVWGTGMAARQWLPLLQEKGLQVAGFVAGAAGEASPLPDVPVAAPETLRAMRGTVKPYLLVASNHAHEIAATLEEYGWRWREDYCY